MNRHTRHLIELVLVVALAVFFGACSNKKNTAGSRFWQSLNTRYNVYYHGRTNYDEQLKEMLDNYQDDYSQRLFVHPAEARANPKAPQPSGSFDRTIEKMQKAIALHSIKKKPNKKSGKGNDPKYKAWMAREEYNPFMHNCWYTLALAQYMKGDFLNASATFRYISRHFSWKPDLVEEAKVWEALSYCAMGWTSEADNVLSHVHLDKINNKRVRSLANLAFADYYIKEKRTALAVPYLAEAVKGAKGSQKVRQNFLLGQLYEELDQKDMAYEAFKRAGSSNSASYRTKFNARIKQSAVYQGYDIAGEVRALKHMTRYDRNKEYLDQIYYAIGNLYLSREDTVHAVENYVLAAEKSTRNGIDKAISQLKLGGIYFAQHKYDKAQPCYAEAVPQLSEDYPNYKALKQRSDVLDELAVYAGNVTLQDSLLKLSKMSDTEVKAVIKKIIDELKKKEKEERENADRESYLADQAAKGNTQQQNKNAPQQFSMNNDKSWYFYNTQTKNAGKTQFQQRWGNRKLEDNWRRRNKQVFSLDGGSTLSDSTLQAMVDSLGNDSIPIDTAALRRAEDPHYEEYYLKQIPKTEEQIQAAHEIIQEGLYNMGVILKDKLEDYEAAAVQFTRLLTDYPDNTYRLDTYYNMYLMYMREGSVNRAAVYRNMILSDFADSKEGKALLDPNYIENLKRMNIEQERMYAEAYANYLNDNNEAVHEAYAEMMRKYPLSKIMPKFMFIDALSYVTQRNYDKFKETLKDMLQRYPETDITPTASGIVKHLNAGRKLEGGGSNARGMLWSTRLSNDTTPQALEGKFTPFKEDNDKPQVFILLYPTDTVSSRLLLYEVARHNFNSFVVKDYDLEQMNFGHLGLLVVKGFENFNEVSHYRKVFDADTSMQIPPQVHQVLISESNFQLLLNEGRTFEDYFNYLQEQEEAKAEKIKKGDKKTSSDDNQDEPDGKKRSVKDKKGKKDDDKKEQLSDSTMVQPIDSLDLSKSQPIDSLQKAMSQPTDSLQTNLTQITDTVSLLTEAEKQLQAQLQQAERERLAQLEREKKEKEEQAEQERLEQMRRQRQEELERAAKLDQELLEKKEQERKEQEMREKEERERRDAEEREKRMQQAENAEKPAMKPAMKPDEPAMKPDEPAMKPDEPAMKPDEPTSSEKTEKTEAEKLGTRSVRDKKSDTSQVTASPKQDKKAQEKAERERLKALDKAEKERAKQLEKEEKEREKALKKEQKEREKAEKRAERMRQDSLLRAEENREKLYKSAREAKEDSIEALQKAKADEIKNKQKEREQAKKDAEKARKERLKAKEKERKLKEKERKERMKEREAKRKEQQKLRKQQQKDREKANKERQKQREEERKQQAAERKAAKGGKSSGGTNATTGRSSRNNTKDGKASGKSTTGKSSVDNNGNAPATGSNDKPDNSGNDKPDLTDNPDGSGKP
jgi:TolA-binding protein